MIRGVSFADTERWRRKDSWEWLFSVYPTVVVVMCFDLMCTCLIVAVCPCLFLKMFDCELAKTLSLQSAPWLSMRRRMIMFAVMLKLWYLYIINTVFNTDFRPQLYNEINVYITICDWWQAMKHANFQKYYSGGRMDISGGLEVARGLPVDIDRPRA